MKHVLVTGGSRGLGLAMVEALLAQGYQVSTCSRSRTDALKALESNADFFHTPLDMEKLDLYEPFLDACTQRFGPLYALVNNAGLAGSGILATFPNIDSERILRVNLMGPLALARLASRSFLKSRAGGRIVNISSILGTRGYNGLAAYSASKAGLDGLTRALARELGPLQVTVNSIAPGYVRTDMSASLSDKQAAQIVRRTPLGRLGEPEDIAGLLLFLLSDQARYITGQTLLVDGGISC